MSITKTCIIDGCGGQIHGYKLCTKHYNSWSKYGNALATEGLREEHGLYKAPEYSAWQNMWSRCRNPNNKNYKYYGARGIKVCERWRKFSNFIKDMGNKPTPKHTIERKDVNKGYIPSNCIWATQFEQNINRRINRNNSSGYRGVSRTNKGWGVYITYNYTSLYILTCKEAQEAAYIRDQVALQLHGPKTLTNFQY